MSDEEFVKAKYPAARAATSKNGRICAIANGFKDKFGSDIYISDLVPFPTMAWADARRRLEEK